MHIACNCGRRSKCVQGRKEFPDSWLPESGPIHCNLLQSIAILQPAGHKMASAPNFPHFHGVCSANLLRQPCWTSIVAAMLKIYCGSLAKICRSSHSIPKFCCRMSCCGIPKKLLNSINSKNSLIFTLFPIYYHWSVLAGLCTYFSIGFWVHIIKCVVFFQSQ